MPFDIRQLHYAIAAADHGSFYRAARALDVDQSTLSRAIGKLERAVGMPIFERSRAGVSMTCAGGAFVRGARPMVVSADKLVTMMRAAGQGRAGGFVLGHNSSVSAGNLRATLMSWRKAHPGVEVECVEADRGVLLAGLDTGEIDIAILMGAAGHDGFRCEPLWSERILAALPASHPLAERDVVHWTDLRGERFLLTVADPGPEMRDMLLGRLSVSGKKPDIRMHQSSRETILSVLGESSGVSIVCEGTTGRLRVGQKILCTEPFETERERKNLRRRLLYLLDELGHSVWVERHSDGNLYYRCIGHLRTREPLWIEQPVDDGSDFKSADVVCCPFDLKSTRAEFRRIRAAIMTSRATADAVCVLHE